MSGRYATYWNAFLFLICGAIDAETRRSLALDIHRYEVIAKHIVFRNKHITVGHHCAYEVKVCIVFGVKRSLALCNVQV